MFPAVGSYGGSLAPAGAGYSFIIQVSDTKNQPVWVNAIRSEIENRIRMRIRQLVEA